MVGRVNGLGYISTSQMTINIFSTISRGGVAGPFRPRSTSFIINTYITTLITIITTYISPLVNIVASHITPIITMITISDVNVIHTYRHTNTKTVT